MTDRPAPICPYCGSMMVYNQCRTTAWYGYYECTKAGCRACAPRIALHGKTGTDPKDKEAAYTAAMERAEPVNRVLTLTEVKAHIAESLDVPSLYMDFIPPNGKWEVHWREGENIRDAITYSASSYGKKWRCWLRKPTPDECAAAKWEG